MPTFSQRIGAGANDYWGWSSGAYDNAGNVRFGTQFGGNYRPFWRFTAVTIPNGATITAATLTVRATSGGDTATCLAVLKGDDKDNQAAYTNSGDITGNFVATTASVNWTLSTTWSGDQVSPDISSIIQEIVNRAGWASGNALQVCADYNATSGSRYVIGYDTTPATAGLLDVTYSTGGSLPPRRAGQRQQHLLVR